ncbi:hypothetical protein K466DRAFT_148370 [Polyporus arcularius HHB13444]|uniref:Fungal-type protein kinase domain-containing protein n=1 Tax=Polyporus arcularius HHB13444 TaxID=1314778 RepID=A0A5C3PEB8_9APHY|nr:hypothetical protein K466DRAFT_148370 [Polyporus arcularius HHB13444]
MLEHENSPTWHPDAQLAVYAAERFRCLPCVTHEVGMVLQDDVIWLFWHDRQGVIQSTGISFVRNAPHFLLVLLAMQRFNSVDWGVPEGFPEQAPTNDLVLLPGSSPEDGIRVNWSEVLHRSSGRLTGRCAQVFRGTRKTSGVVVKISHRDKSRLTEDYIVKRARGEAEESMKFPLKTHLPVCLFSCDLRHDSAWIREFLNGSADGLSASRIPRITVWEALLPIYQLPAADFVRCWLKVIHAHRVLWEKGIRHLNPSLANTMVRMVEGKSRGVLNDWELATIRGESRHDASELTGNWLFMAVELMTDEGLSGHVPRLYRYDLEGFTWILLWVFMQYDEENTVHETDQTWLWKSSSLDNARNAKEDFLVVARGCKPQEKWKDQWALAERMRRIFARINITGRMMHEVEALFGHTAKGQQGDTSVEDDEELSDEEMYTMFWEEIDGYYGSLGTAGLQELSATSLLPVALPRK